MKRNFKIFQILLLLTFLFPSISTFATERGTNLYILGLGGYQAGVMPDQGTYLQSDYYYYQGKNSIVDPLTGLKVKFSGHGWLEYPTITYVTPLKVFGAKYAIMGNIPFGKVDITQKIPLINSKESKNASGISDSVLIPIALGWKFDELNILGSLTVYFPTGHFNKNSFANIGLNRYGLDPGIGITWINKKYNFEISNWTGYTINFTNTYTHYKSGQELHSEFYLGKNFNDSLSLGMVSYFYYQTTGDSGKGAILGSYKGRVMAFGPILVWNFELKKIPIMVNARYYKEFDAKNRTEGEAFYLTAFIPLPFGREKTN